MNNNKSWENFYNPQLFGRLGCTLQAYGANFEPNVFLDLTNIPKEKIIFKGTLGLPDEIRERVNNPDDITIFDTPYLVIKISDAADISLQIDEAMLFLKEYTPDLIKLRSYPNVESVLIKFSCNGKASFSDFSIEFNKLSSEIGLDNIII
jgi:hypothetical protein